MDLTKLQNSKALKITAIIVLPTVLVVGYFGYKYYKKRQELKRANSLLEEMREKYKNINNIDEFIEGLKYVVQTSQFGYDLAKMESKKADLEKLDFEGIKAIYELLKRSLSSRTEDENRMVLDFLTQLYNK